MQRIILATSAIVRPKNKCYEDPALVSTIGGAGRHNPSISSLGETDSIEDKVRFECFSVLSASVISTVKELVKMMKEIGLSINRKRDVEDSILKQGSEIVSS